MFRILVLTLDGVVDSSLALTLDAIATANRIAHTNQKKAPLEAILFNPGRKRIRTGLGGTYAVRPSVPKGRVAAVVVPGLGLAAPKEVDTFLSHRRNGPALEWLRTRGAKAPLVAASCSAVFPLAEAGLLEGRIATTSWWLGAAFRQRYPGVELDESRMTVESKGVLTAGAALAQIDLMLHLISRACGPAMSRDVSRYLAIDRRPSQSRYMMLSAVSGVSEDLVEIDRWIRERIAQSFSVPEVAKAMGVSPRTLDRRIRAVTGGGAKQFIQQTRLEQAAHLLETSNQSLAAIAEQVGYQDVSTLRRLIRQRIGANPSELRQRGPRQEEPF